MAKRSYLEFVQAVFDRAGERAITGSLTTLVAQNHVITQVADYVNYVYMKIAARKAWWWLQSSARIRLLAPYETGTITTIAGDATVVGVGTLFLTNTRAGDFLRVGTQNEVYEVLSVTDDTNLELTTNVIDALAASSYKLVRPHYDLPADYKLSRRWAWDLTDDVKVDAVDMADFQLIRNGLMYIASPDVYTIYGIRTDTGVDYQQLWVTPQPDSARDLEIQYKAAATKLSADADESLIPEEFEDVLIDGALGMYYKYVVDDTRFDIANQDFESWIADMLRQQGLAEPTQVRLVPNMSAKKMAQDLFSHVNHASYFIARGGLD